MRAALPVLLAAIACGRDHRGAPAAETTRVVRPAHFDAGAIDRWVAAELEERGVIGASLVVVRDGATVLAKGYGVARSGAPAPVDARTPFAIGSVSKQFTCALVAMLAEDGELAMTDPVARWYPDATRAADITLADLGGHTSGYRDYYPLDYVDARIAQPIEPDALIARYAGMPLDFEPRARFSYSNTGHVMLARIAERVGGGSFAEQLRARIFAPLGMTTAQTTRPEGAASGHDSFLLEPPTPARLEGAGWLLGAADLWMSAEDLARWNLALADGTVLPPAALAAIATPRVLPNGKPTGYGCGLGVRYTAGETVLTHSGWVGGFVAYSAVAPRRRTSVVLLVNDQHAGVGDLHGAVLSLALDDPSVIPTIAGPPIVDVARTLVAQLQQGRIDRELLGEDLDAYLDDTRLAKAAQTLRALGTPRITLVERHERGGMEHATVRLAFPDKTVEMRLFRSPDGKLRQILMSP